MKKIDIKKRLAENWFSYLQIEICNQFQRLQNSSKGIKKSTFVKKNGMDFYKLFGVFEDMEKISREHLRVRIGTFYDGGFKPGMISVENVGKMEIETTTEGISVMIKIGEILTLRISHFEYFFRPGVYPSEDIFYGVPHKWKLISNE